MFDFIDYFIPILINISLLFSLGSIFIIFPFKDRNTPIRIQIISGLLIGIIGLIIMNAQFNITEGFLLDTRSILLSVTAAFLGIIPGLIIAVILSAFRIYQGGAGALTGVIVIFATMVVGLAFRKYRLRKVYKKEYYRYLDLYVFGIVTHLVMLLCFFALPYNVAIKVLGLIFWPVLILFPLATIPIGIIMYKQRKNMENSTKVEFISEHDYLTGLYNRHFLEEAFKKYDKLEFYPLCIIMGDVNGLKLINDTYGHLKGDELLIVISNIMKKQIDENEILARWGGDEFMIILPNSDLERGQLIIRNIKERCKKELFYEIEPSISLGCAVKESIDENIDKIMSLAEEIMYRNKLSESKSVRSNFITVLEKTLLERNYESENHSNNLINFGVLIGEKLGLSQPDIDEIKLVARLHDVGKIGISESILLKNGKLTFDEYEEVKKHTLIGYRILDSVDELKHISKYVLHHHERWDGEGYPAKLKGNNIPLLSRIITISDAYEVMISGRVYQSPMSEEDAITELRKNSGTQFDPNLIQIFLSIIDNKNER